MKGGEFLAGIKFVAQALEAGVVFLGLGGR